MFLGVCRETSLDVAVKIINQKVPFVVVFCCILFCSFFFYFYFIIMKVFIKNSEILREILILHCLSHPNIIRYT